MHKSRLRKLILLLLLSAGAYSILAEDSSAPAINAESAILIDMETGTVLYEKSADTVIPPASMTKLMTMHIALEAVKNGQCSLDDYVPVGSNADFRNQPPHSSLMFIEEGQKVTLSELLTGLAIPSGNDAAVAVADFIAGSTPEFIRLMNAEADRLGLKNTHFEDTSGYSEGNSTTAREYAAFCSYYINEHPQSLLLFHAIPEFTYPAKQNLPENGESVYGPITQYNHNQLAGRYPGVDGLKTGYIDESGFNIAATCIQNGRRLLVVLMGGPGSTTSDGNLRRLVDISILLTYGYEAWTVFNPGKNAYIDFRIWKGQQDFITAERKTAAAICLKYSDIIGAEYIDMPGEPLEAPVSRGDELGSWELVSADGRLLAEGRLIAMSGVQEGNWLKRKIDQFWFSRTKN